MKNKKKKKILHIHHVFLSLALFFGVVITLTPFVVYATYEYSFRGRVYPGVKLSGAQERVTAAVIKLSYSESPKGVKEFSVQASQFGIYIDWPATREKLMRVGRSGDFWEDLNTKIVAYRSGVTIDPALSYDHDLVDQTINTIAGAIDVPVVEPKFRFDGQRVTAFQLGSPGRSVDRSLLTNRLLAAVFSQNPEPVVEIPVRAQEPQKTPGQQTAESMGIRQLLGRGISTYRGSIVQRRHNVALTARKIDGTLVPPGATFSFNDTLGDVSQSTGFQQAYVISEGRTILGDGGGVCQDSTTLFRAVLNAGLPVVERRAHSYRVGYYEQNSPPGLDATVSAPSPDFKFQNNTPANILIQAKVDEKSSTLVYELWGTSDGRTATISKPVVSDLTAAPPDLYQDDPSLRSGQIKQVDWKAQGARVVFSYVVKRGGEILHQDKFVSVYRPWQAVFLQGTGG